MDTVHRLLHWPLAGTVCLLSVVLLLMLLPAHSQTLKECQKAHPGGHCYWHEVDGERQWDTAKKEDRRPVHHRPTRLHRDVEPKNRVTSQPIELADASDKLRPHLVRTTDEAPSAGLSVKDRLIPVRAGYTGPQFGWFEAEFEQTQVVNPVNTVQMLKETLYGWKTKPPAE